ncbi:MAG: hypothetical protein ACFFE3_09920 [Candidatus Thorarchaeota archaeon]
MDILVSFLGLALLTILLAIIFDKKSTHRGHADILNKPTVKSPIARILDMGPQCAQAVGVYKTHQDRENLRKQIDSV